MAIWTTFCPSKICWELTYVQTSFGSAQDKQGKPTSNWLEHQDLIINSLKLLKKHGISGIRLVVFPNEITQDGRKYDWTAIETMLTLCHKLKILVDLCLGPYQYPYYPGIYLPAQLVEYVFDNDNALDTNPELRKYGMTSLQMQLERYGQDDRIVGFHLANEWPDSQHISGKESIKKIISEDFMTRAASLCKASTDKPIRLNTNIRVSDKTKITNIFTNIFTILGNQAHLGFDIYPSQETWLKQPLQRIRLLFETHAYTFREIKKVLKGYSLYFAEIEAQPWGDGRSWYDLIKNESNPEQSILSYSSLSLIKTWNMYIKRTNSEIVSLWGSDFWLAAYAMGITWPLKQVKIISSGDV